MESRALRLAFALGLALAPRAWAGEAFQAVLVGSNEVPGPGISEGGFDAVVVLEGTKVTLTLTPKGITGWMSAHIHKGPAGVDGRLVAEFPWESGDGSPRRYVGSVSKKVAADMAANPEKYYVHVHLPNYPAGGARGQLAARPNVEVTAVQPPAAATTIGSGLGAVPPPGSLPLVQPPALMQAMPDPQQPPPSPKDQSIYFPPVRSRVYRDSDFRLDASASSGLRVYFTGSGDCNVYGSTVHILSAGKCWVTAHQPGDARFSAASDVEQLIPIAKASQRIVGAPPEAKTYLDPDFPLDMSATSGLSVVFFAWGDCTVSGSYIHITGAGSCSLTAHQPGDSNYLAARIVDGRFPIARADQTIDFADLPNPYYGNLDLQLYAHASSGLPVVYDASGPCGVLGSTLRVFDSGECFVTADQPGDRNFNAAPSVKKTFQIVVRYVLVGSMAMAAQGLVRATRDADFFVAPDEENVGRLRRALRSLFDDDPNVDQITAADLGGAYPAIEYTPPHGRYSMDFLSRLGEAFHFEGIDAQDVDVEGVRARVATPRMLYRMKKGTVRPQDRIDAETIRSRFDLKDE